MRWWTAAKYNIGPLRAAPQAARVGIAAHRNQGASSIQSGSRRKSCVRNRCEGERGAQVKQPQRSARRSAVIQSPGWYGPGPQISCRKGGCYLVGWVGWLGCRSSITIRSTHRPITKPPKIPTSGAVSMTVFLPMDCSVVSSQVSRLLCLIPANSVYHTRPAPAPVSVPPRRTPRFCP